MPLASQIQLPARYRPLRYVASGGMASVWEVEDCLLGRTVAVKLLASNYAADPAARTRFAREARTAARAGDHPHVATIYDIGEHEENAFIVMEFFAGGTVADRLREAKDAGEPVARETALRWLREAAAGLDHAHAAGVVHRDVKPANLLLDGRGRLAVADFGIARLADDTQMTKTGQVLGTAAYLSPEQVEGQPATGASDRYAFAIVAFELVTGQRPFAGGPSTAQARQHVEAEPARPSEVAGGVPRALDAVLAEALSKDPAQRPGSAAELVGAIAEALGAPATTDPAATGPTAPTRRVAAAAAAPAAAAAALDPNVPADRTARQPVAGEPAAARVAPMPAEPPAARPAQDGGEPRAQPARRSMPALVPIGIVAAIVGVVVAVALATDGGPSGPGPVASAPTAGSSERPTQTARAPQPAPAPPAAQPAAKQPADSADPAALNDRGFALLRDGDHAGAVDPLRASVAGYRDAGRTDDLGYAYALYNLGVALNRSGDPAAAIPVLEERMKYKNQRGTVKQELKDARSKLDGSKQAKGKQKDGDDAE